MNPRWLPAAMPADLVVRLPFILLLALTLLCTWRAVFNLARSPGAQPVAFAFGGEASPTDYARALADGGLLALLACLGLAQLSHETSHTLVQLSAVSAIFFAAASMWWQPKLSAVAALLGTLALTLAGAPSMAAVLGAGATAMALCIQTPKLPQRYSWAAWWLLSIGVAAATTSALGLWEYRLINPWVQGKDWQSLARLLMWFSWPAWPLSLWAMWRWRWQLQRPAHNPHVAWPLWLWATALFCTIFTQDGDRALILALPAIAALAAFALPTFKRSLAALIDWLTLFFFSISAIAAWLLLVAWRTRRHRAAIWKSLAVPAGGTVLGWVLLMTLWLPMLDYGRSYAPHVNAVAQVMPKHVQCVHTLGFNAALTTAFRFHTPWKLESGLNTATGPTCNWLIATPAAWSAMDSAIAAQWQLVEQVARPTDRRDHLLVLRRAP